ncbi:magnesium transporter MRS2-I [Tanacetum coccineum]
MAELAVEGVGMTVKKKNTRSWILIDSKVNETIMDIDKYAIMHRVQIHARDLRILDPLLSYPSAIPLQQKPISPARFSPATYVAGEKSLNDKNTPT